MKNRPNQPHEPSDREKCQKIDQAIAAIEAGRVVIIDSRHNQLAMDFLDAIDMEEVIDWMPILLGEIKALGPPKCFVGRQAQRCRHRGFNNLFLFAYHWNSPSLGEEVYLKFGIQADASGIGSIFTYCHLDCHEDNA